MAISTKELEKQIQELSAALEKVQKENAEAKKALSEKPDAALLAAKDAEIARLRAGMDANKFVPQPVQGSFEASVRTPNGQKQKKTFRFRDGALAVRVPSGTIQGVAAGQRLSTEGLMLLAAGKKPTKEQILYSPSIASVSQEDAINLLAWLASVRSGQLEEV